MRSPSVSAVLFVKDLPTVAAFYSAALGMKVIATDEHHARLACHGFGPAVHQIPTHVAEDIALERARQATQTRCRMPFRNG